MVKLVPIVRGDRSGLFGCLKGKIKLHANFDDPLPPDLLKAFGVE